MSTHPLSPNLLLASLAIADQAPMLALLERVELRRDMMLYEAGDTLRHAYFPLTAVVSLTASMQDGASTEIAVVGNEGVVGVCAFMGGGRSHSSAIVQRAGSAWRLRASIVAGMLSTLGSVMPAMLRYTQVLLAQIAQTSACGRHHALEQQLCRWLLQYQDRMPDQALMMTQERIAMMLGVRREGITTHALRLRDAGLIDYGRGRIAILDRAGLERRSCECYAVVKGALDGLHVASAPQADPVAV
jgi:CRP-like cAMP-binding protein